MSVACLNLLHVLNPKHLVFTGHLAEVMVEPVQRFVNRRALKNARERLQVYASNLENPALLGAASLVIESWRAAWMKKKSSWGRKRTAAKQENEEQPIEIEWLLRCFAGRSGPLMKGSVLVTWMSANWRKKFLIGERVWFILLLSCWAKWSMGLIFGGEKFPFLIL